MTVEPNGDSLETPRSVHSSWDSPSLSQLFQLYKVCMARICVRTPDGDLANGAAFHIGDGYLVTARHCVEGVTIETIQAESSVPREVMVHQVFTLDDPKIDLAVLKTDFSLEAFMKLTTIVEGPYDPPGPYERPKVDHVPLGGHLDDWLGDEFLLTRVLTMGYPTVPLSAETQLVASVGEVNAIVDRYDSPHPHFVVSTIGRGGFSGGPVISEYGFLLGVYTGIFAEDVTGDRGFPAALSVEPLLSLMWENGIFPGPNSEILHSLYDTFEDTSLDHPATSEAMAADRARIAEKRAANPWYQPQATNE